MNRLKEIYLFGNSDVVPTLFTNSRKKYVVSTQDLRNENVSLYFTKFSDNSKVLKLNENHFYLLYFYI